MSDEESKEEQEHIETQAIQQDNPSGDSVSAEQYEEAEPVYDVEDEEDGIEKSDEYLKLVGLGLPGKVASEIEVIYSEGLMSPGELDERAVDALKEFPVEGAINVLKQFRETNLEHVTNKSAYLCGMLKTFRTRNRMKGDLATLPKGPDEAKLKEILDRTKYTLDVTTGQRKYGGPPPDVDPEDQPGPGCEVFCGKIPKDLFEDELIPLFENCGKIWDLRLMMDALTGLNRGYAFVTFCDKEGANEAVKQLDKYEIRKGRFLGVCKSTNNTRLYIANIPKHKDNEEIKREFSQHAPGLLEVIIYSSPDDKKKNRGFCFLEYESHKAASLAKRRLSTGRVRPWNCDIIVDWADPIDEPDAETMSKVKVLYVRNLKSDVTEDKLKELFDQFGKIERVKKIKDYGFIHFEERDDCIKAMEEMNGKEVEGANLEISLAKPPTDKKKKEQRMREQERRLMMMRGYGDYYGYPPYYVGAQARRGGGRGGASSYGNGIF